MEWYIGCESEKAALLGYRDEGTQTGLIGVTKIQENVESNVIDQIEVASVAEHRSLTGESSLYTIQYLEYASIFEHLDGYGVGMMPIKFDDGDMITLLVENDILSTIWLVHLMFE